VVLDFDHSKNNLGKRQKAARWREKKELIDKAVENKGREGRAEQANSEVVLSRCFRRCMPNLVKYFHKSLNCAI
jgi:hypothetical protein